MNSMPSVPRGTRVRRMALLMGALAALTTILATSTGSARERAIKRATCFGKPATIVGTGHRDVITTRLTDHKDVVVAKGGNDVIKASSTRNNHGEDIVCGNSGEDEILANNEKNVLVGGPGKDKLNAGPSIDFVVGDNANPNGDEDGPTANDKLLGGAGGNDLMVGDNYASGDARGSSPDRRLLGARGDDTLIGASASRDGDASGGGTDHLEGAAGNDRVIGDSFAPRGAAVGGGNDEVNTGPGKDLGVGDSYTVSGTAKGNGRDDVHGADGGNAGATCATHACDDQFFGDNYAAICPRMGPCRRISGGGQDLLNSDQGADFLNGGPPNDPDARPRQDICSGGTGRDTGTQCEYYRSVQVRLPSR